MFRVLEVLDLRLLTESRLSELLARKRCGTVEKKWVFAAVKKKERDRGHLVYDAACWFLGGYQLCGGICCHHKPEN